MFYLKTYLNMFIETKRINISKIIYANVTLNKRKRPKNMTKPLRCPYGIPENEYCQASSCPTWVARQKSSSK
jgi:hypothetical protein